MKPPSTSGSRVTVKSAKDPFFFLPTALGWMMVWFLSALTFGWALRCSFTTSMSLYFSGSRPLRATAEMMKTGQPYFSSRSPFTNSASSSASGTSALLRMMTRGRSRRSPRPVS